jgi:PmbA protein
MHALMKRAKETVDQAELYWSRRHTINVLYQNYLLQQVEENDLSSVALRVIENERLGNGYGVFPDRGDLLESARPAPRFGDPATFSFAPASSYPAVRTYDERTAGLTSQDLIDLCESVKKRIHEQLPDIPLVIRCQAETSQLLVESTEGAEGEVRATDFSIGFGASFRGVGVSIFKGERSISPLTAGKGVVDEFIEWYRWGERTSTPSTGRLPVILAPEAAFLLLLPLLMGVSGDLVSKKTSPLLGRIGRPILSEKLTVIDDALADGDPNARPFDDEGTPCETHTIVEDGVLRDYITDLRSGAALDHAPTGNGFKAALFGGGSETSPTPWFANPAVRPGRDSWRDLVNGLDEGLLVTNGMGFHSGNYPQGQFAVQAVGYHIIGGKVVGRLDKTMISGNIYEDFHNVRGVSRERRRSVSRGLLATGPVPYVLVDSLQVAGN